MSLLDVIQEYRYEGIVSICRNIYQRLFADKSLFESRECLEQTRARGGVLSLIMTFPCDLFIGVFFSGKSVYDWNTYNVQIYR